MHARQDYALKMLRDVAPTPTDLSKKACKNGIHGHCWSQLMSELQRVFWEGLTAPEVSREDWEVSMPTAGYGNNACGNCRDVAFTVKSALERHWSAVPPFPAE